MFFTVDPAFAALLPAAVLAVGLLLVTSMRRREAAHRFREVAVERDRAREDRRRFLLRLDHELKNPLQAIRVGLALGSAREAPAPLQGFPPRSVAGTPPGPPGARAVDLQVVRITRLITDLRKLAELEVHTLEREPVDLRDLLEEVAAAAADLPGADTRNLRTVVPRAPWPLPAVTGDRDLLFVALHNLMANAVKYSSPGDAIELRASEDKDTVVVEVADTGAGIPTDEQELVWDELARGRGARALPGSGLGLSLVQVVDARHGGTTALRSRAGEGTVITIRLPAAPRRPGGPRPATRAALAGHRTDRRHPHRSNKDLRSGKPPRSHRRRLRRPHPIPARRALRPRSGR